MTPQLKETTPPAAVPPDQELRACEASLIDRLALTRVWLDVPPHGADQEEARRTEEFLVIRLAEVRSALSQLCAAPPAARGKR